MQSKRLWSQHQVRGSGALVGCLAVLWSLSSHAATVAVDCSSGPEPLFDAMVAANCDPEPDIILLSGGACVWGDSSPQEDRSLLPAVSTPITIRGVESAPIQFQQGLGTSRNRYFRVTAAGRLRLVRLSLQEGRGSLVDAGDYGGGAVLNEGVFEARHVSFSDARSLDKGGALDNRGKAHLFGTSFEDNETGVFGGAIYNDGTLNVSRSYFTGNSDIENGGAIFSRDDLTVDDSVFYSNSSEDAGGVDASGTVIIRRSTFIDNSGLNAGALHVRNGDLFLSDSEILENWSTSGGASGVFLQDATGHILRTTIASNTAELGPAGVQSTASQVLIDSCTISDNGPPDRSASYVQSMGGSGFTIVNSTLSGNRSLDDFAIDLSDSVLIHNTIVGNDSPLRLTNSTFRGNIIENEGASCELINSTSGGYNLSSDASCGLSPLLGDLPESDPRVGPLTDNGGPTLTHRPLLESPALGAVPTTSCVDGEGAPLVRDQRGIRRATRGTCDIGAVERRLR